MLKLFSCRCTFHHACKLLFREFGFAWIPKPTYTFSLLAHSLLHHPHRNPPPLSLQASRSKSGGNRLGTRRVLFRRVRLSQRQNLSDHRKMEPGPQTPTSGKRNPRDGDRKIEASLIGCQRRNSTRRTCLLPNC